MKQIFQIIIGFLHDFAAGCWAATVFAIYWINNKHFALHIVDSLFGLKKDFFQAGLVCIAVVFLTGAGRSFTYVNNVYGKKAERTRRMMLIAKHIILFAVFGYGTWWQYNAVFH